MKGFDCLIGCVAVLMRLVREMHERLEGAFWLEGLDHEEWVVEALLTCAKVGLGVR